MTDINSYGTVTKVGITAAIDAGRNGPEIKVTGFRIGSLSAAEGAQALDTDTDVDGFVYAGTADQMKYSRIDNDTVVWRIALGQEIGNFDVGNIGLVLESGVVFAKAVLVGQSNKYKSNPPQIIGNRKFYNIVLVLSNVANLLDLTIIDSTEASLPEVPTELDLPDPTTSIYNAYLVLNHTHLGEPTVAVRRTGEWYHQSHYKYPNQGIGVMACVPTMYHASAVVGKVVHYDVTSSKFVLADGSDGLLQPDGIRTSSYEMTVTGMIGGDAVGLTLPLVPGTVYYCGTGAGAGDLSETVSGRAVAIAISTVDLWINLGGSLDLTNGGTGDPTIVITIDPDTVNPVLAAGSVVYLNSSRIWQAADPLDAAKRPIGMLNADKTKVVILGKLQIEAVTAAWPKPLTTGALYYASTGGTAGNIVASGTATRFIVGTAHSADTLIVNFLALAADSEHLVANSAAITAKAATPAGVGGAIAEHAAAANHPVATSSVVGFGRPATNLEITNGAAADLPAYQSPWVTPAQLATYPFPSFDGSIFVHNNTDSEPVANGRVLFVREVGLGNRGKVILKGRVSQLGGGGLAFTNEAGDVERVNVDSNIDGRSLGFSMFSDNGTTKEDQARLTDAGDLWLRKIGNVSDAAFVKYGIVASGTNDLIVTTITPDVTAYTVPLVVIIKLLFTNTTNMRINIKGLGLRSIVNPNLTEIDPGTALVNSMLVLVYDGTKFQAVSGIQSQLTDFPVGSVITVDIAGPTSGLAAVTLGNTYTAAALFGVSGLLNSGTLVSSFSTAPTGSWKCISIGASDSPTASAAVSEPHAHDHGISHVILKRVS